MPLLICRTCPRYDTAATGRFGRELDAAIGDNPGAAGLRIRHVQCLGGCPEDGVVAVDGMGKARVRCADWTVPAQLAGRISTVTFKRAPHI